VAAPGSPERAWLTSLLTAPPGPAIRVNSISVGPRGAAGALEEGTADAALVAEPDGSDLVETERGVLLADLRDPAAAQRATGKPTLNAAVFIGPDRALAADTLERLGRALLAAERRLATAEPAALAEQLPGPVVGLPAEFARRLETSGRIYLPDGRVTPDRLAATIELIRAHLPLPVSLKIPPAEELILMGRLEPR
jgi:ABC-type nitrate/sulfonate/bicarbonate transport system substrate-binding protein